MFIYTERERVRERERHRHTDTQTQRHTDPNKECMQNSTHALTTRAPAHTPEKQE